jgi:hypothetical protein
MFGIKRMLIALLTCLLLLAGCSPPGPATPTPSGPTIPGGSVPAQVTNLNVGNVTCTSFSFFNQKISGTLTWQAGSANTTGFHIYSNDGSGNANVLQAILSADRSSYDFTYTDLGQTGLTMLVAANNDSGEAPAAAIKIPYTCKPQ